MKKAANAARAGTLALAAFVSRPQAEAQIGANSEQKLYHLFCGVNIKFLRSHKTTVGTYRTSENVQPARPLPAKTACPYGKPAAQDVRAQ